LRGRQPPGVQPADLAVGSVRAEGGVDPAQPLEHPVERRRIDAVLAHLDEDRHPHDVFDAEGGVGGRCERAHHRLAFTIAACSDWT
jgi:hypothetical protein